MPYRFGRYYIIHLGAACPFLLPAQLVTFDSRLTSRSVSFLKGSGLLATLTQNVCTIIQLTLLLGFIRGKGMFSILHPGVRCEVLHFLSCQIFDSCVGLRN